MKKLQTRQDGREVRRARVRAKLIGTASSPRLNVFRSLRQVFAQLIDDTTGKTLASVHGRVVKKADVGDRKGKIAVAYLVGMELAEKAKALNIKSVVFDRAGYKYHGRVKAVADGARAGGLKF